MYIMIPYLILVCIFYLHIEWICNILNTMYLIKYLQKVQKVAHNGLLHNNYI